MEHFEQLKQEAVRALEFSYSPYSNYPVGAAIFMEDGNIYTGANIENASYPMAICAECTAIVRSQMHKAGKILELVCVDGSGNVLVPCGKCRQTIYEFAKQGETEVAVSETEVLKIEELLAHPFGPANLSK